MHFRFVSSRFRAAGGGCHRTGPGTGARLAGRRPGLLRVLDPPPADLRGHRAGRAGQPGLPQTRPRYVHAGTAAHAAPRDRRGRNRPPDDRDRPDGGEWACIRTRGLSRAMLNSPHTTARGAASFTTRASTAKRRDNPARGHDLDGVRAAAQTLAGRAAQRVDAVDHFRHVAAAEAAAQLRRPRIAMAPSQVRLACPRQVTVGPADPAPAGSGRPSPGRRARPETVRGSQAVVERPGGTPGGRRQAVGHDLFEPRVALLEPGAGLAASLPCPCTVMIP